MIRPKLIEFIKKRGLKVSASEPSTGEEVWIKKGKNIIPTDTAWESGTINDSGAETASTNTVRSINYFPVLPAQQYIASYNSDANTFLNVVACYDENKQFISRLTAMRKAAFTLPAGTRYIRPAFYNSNGLTPAQVVSNITNKQIEQGATATSYEAPVDKEIYYKNNNGIYEQFYKEEPIEYGSNSNGSYIKYANGVAIQWGVKTCITSNEAFSSGGFTHYTSPNTYDLPIPFTTSYQIFADVNSANMVIVCLVYAERNNDRSKFNLNFIASQANYSRDIHWFAIGRWK